MLVGAHLVTRHYIVVRYPVRSSNNDRHRPPEMPDTTLHTLQRFALLGSDQHLPWPCYNSWHSHNRNRSPLLLLHRDSRFPMVAVHLHRCVGKVAYEYSAAGRCLTTEAGRYPIIHVQLRWEKIAPAAAFPAVAQPRVRPADQQEVGQVLLQLRQHRRVVAIEGVHHSTRLRRTARVAVLSQPRRTACLLDDGSRPRAADSVSGASRPQHLPRKLARYG